MFSDCEIGFKIYQSTWKTSEPEPRRRAQWWSTQDATPLSPLPSPLSPLWGSRSNSGAQFPGVHPPEEALPPSGLQSLCAPALPAELPKDYGRRLGKPDPPPGGNDLPTRGARPKRLAPQDRAHTRGGGDPRQIARSWSCQGARETRGHFTQTPGPEQKGDPWTKAQGNQGGFLPRGGGVCLEVGWRERGLGGRRRKTGLGREWRAFDAKSRLVSLWWTVGVTEGFSGG